MKKTLILINILIIFLILNLFTYVLAFEPSDDKLYKGIDVSRMARKYRF